MYYLLLLVQAPSVALEAFAWELFYFLSMNCIILVSHAIVEKPSHRLITLFRALLAISIFPLYLFALLI